mgnify:CR=1 FL=1
MQDIPLTLHLPYPPSVNSLYANRPGIGRVKSERYRTWERAATNMLMAQQKRVFAGNVAVDIQIEKIDHRKRDVANLEKAPLDILKGVAYADDSQVTDLRIRWSDVKDCVVTVRAI